MAYQTKKKLNLEDNVYQAGLQNNVQKVNTTPQPKIYSNAFQTGVETGGSNTPPSYVPSKGAIPGYGSVLNSSTGNALLDVVGDRLITNYNGGVGASQQSSAVKPYQQYFEEEKKALEEQRNQALQDAKLYEERAAADAQSAYAQNRATYGANAEQLSQMGLTGGGYSDYLNAQAYAQKRSDIQSAGAKRADLESQAQATYSAGIAALNKEQADLEQKKQDEYAAYLTDLQNATNYANYTEDGIIALGNQKGWTASQVAEAVKVWNAAKKANEIESEVGDGNDATQYSATAYINAIRNGQYAGTREELYEACLQNRNAGYMTEPEVAEVMKQYDNWKAYKDGKISADVYYNAIAGDEAAQNTMNNVSDQKTFNENAINMAISTLQSLGLSENEAKHATKGKKVVNTNTGTVTVGSFGNYQDNDKQDAYWDALKKELGNVQVGQFIKPNYGSSGLVRGDEFFLCVAPGVFVSFKGDLSVAQSKLYIPSGYKLTDWGNIRRDSSED